MKRTRINDRQCEMFRKDLQEFGYVLNFEQIRRVANQVANGTYNRADPIALILISQIDEAAELRRNLGKGELPPEIPE